MELTKSFPPADALIENLLQIDYQKLYKNSKTFVLTVAAIVYVISNIIWEKLQTMKFSTPHFLTEYFYFSVNLIGEPGDEIVGLSVGNRYVGLYNNGIAWGILNENGAL
jgi:lipoprotein signal peptidase